MAVCACAWAASGAAAASREPVSVLNAALNGEGVELSAPSSAGASGRVTARASAATAAALPSVSSTAYGAEQTEAVARILSGLDHGPELASQHVFVATPEEVAGRCGEEVIACYFPGATEMVVSGSAARAAACRANSRSPTSTATRSPTASRARSARRSTPGRSAGRPTSASASSPAPASSSPATRAATTGRTRRRRSPKPTRSSPTRAPRCRGSSARTWRRPPRHWRRCVPTSPTPGAARRRNHGTPPSPRPPRRHVRAPGATAPPRSPPPAPSARRPARRPKTLSTPLDGEVTVSLTTSSSTPLAVRLVDPETGRTLARGATDATGAATLTFQNCGHESLEVQVRNRGSARRVLRSAPHPSLKPFRPPGLESLQALVAQAR